MCSFRFYGGLGAWLHYLPVAVQNVQCLEILQMRIHFNRPLQQRSQQFQVALTWAVSTPAFSTYTIISLEVSGVGFFPVVLWQRRTPIVNTTSKIIHAAYFMSVIWLSVWSRINILGNLRLIASSVTADKFFSASVNGHIFHCVLLLSLCWYWRGGHGALFHCSETLQNVIFGWKLCCLFTFWS